MVRSRWFLFGILTILVGCTQPPKEGRELQAKAVVNPLMRVELSEPATVVRVVDGDTIQVRIIDTGVLESVRIIGIDTPEIDWKREKTACYADEARKKLSALLRGRRINLLSKEGEDRDVYRRLLRYVHIDKEDVGTMLLLGGYARTFPWFTHPRLEQYAAYEKEAREAGAGLWSACEN